MSGFIELVSVDSLEQSAMLEVELEGHPFLVARIGEEYFVTDARCPHMGGHLAKGVLEGSVVTCPRHHSQFDLRDGTCLRWTSFTGAILTVAELAKHPRPLRAYESKVEDGVVYVGPEKPPGRIEA